MLFVVRQRVGICAFACFCFEVMAAYAEHAAREILLRSHGRRGWVFAPLLVFASKSWPHMQNTLPVRFCFEVIEALQRPKVVCILSIICYVEGEEVCLRVLRVFLCSWSYLNHCLRVLRVAPVLTTSM